MANKSNSNKIPPFSGQPPPAAASSAAPECESCRSAPGIPFCRVDWSFLCTGCASVVHSHNCVISVTPNPNPNPNPNSSHLPYYPYPYPFPNPSFDPNPTVHLTSDDDDLSPAEGWRQIPARACSYRRMESVMRYREKRKSRKFEKTVRYENRRAYAELRPRLDGKFACSKSEEGKEVVAVRDAVDGVSARPEEVRGDLEGLVAGGVELGQVDFIEDVRFQ